MKTPVSAEKQCVASLFPCELENCDRSASFLQSGFWGSFKARFGWNARSFLVHWEGFQDSPLLVIRRRLAPGISFAYIPWGPELPAGFPTDRRNNALMELACLLKNFLPLDTAFIRFDPPWFTEGEGEGFEHPYPPFIRAGADVQCPDTVLLDLAQGMENLVAGMKPKWRYNARLALKKGVRVREAGEDGLELFYSLLKETARRDGIAIHGIEYYRALFSHGREYRGGGGPQIRLYLADHEGDLLAGVFVLLRGNEAVYLYGASSDKKRNLMAPYALQMKAVEDASSSGCLVYDLFGIPPNEDPSHPMAGLYRFKTGFGGRIIHRIGSWDFPCKPLVYSLYRTAETLRKNIRTLKKRSSRHSL
jgi:lipid II:glycine glycyltransferase (peptidoglycan interpeptide bridge formation enzyme)